MKKIVRTNPRVPPYAMAGGQPMQRFRGVASPSENFVAIQNNLRSPPIAGLIDLSVARSVAAGTALVLEFAGNSFYVDSASDVGNASVHFQDATLTNPQPPIFIGPQFIARVPFTRVLFENVAQPAKVLRFFYGVDIDFVPGLNNQVVITGTVDTIDVGFTPGVIFQSNAIIAANTPDNIIAAGSNLNGYLLHDAIYGGFTAGATSFCTFLAKATAPATIVDGDVLAAGICSSIAGPSMPGSIAPRNVASGLRLDRITGVLSSNNIVAAHYTLF